PESQLAEPAVADDRRVVAVGRPDVLHLAGTGRVEQDGVEREHAHVLVAADGVDEPVQAADLPVVSRMTVVPGDELGDLHRRPELLAAHDHAAQVGRRCRDRAALGDVVDAALDDEDVRAASTRDEAPGDLVRPLAVDAAVAELETWILLLCPVLPLALRDLSL